MNVSGLGNESEAVGYRIPESPAFQPKETS